MKFVDRGSEMKSLQSLYTQPQAALMILYGRRRIGKTALLSHWIKTKHVRNSMFWIATTTHSALQLQDFSQALLRFDPNVGTNIAENFTFRDWESAFLRLAEIAERSPEPVVIVIDEFTYLVRNDASLVSVLQKVWDHRLSQVPNLRLILTGSLIGLMERDILSAQAPLYGRATQLMKLRPLHFGCLKELFPAWPADARVAVYAACGGIPAYLAQFYDAPNFPAGLRKCLAPTNIMVTDPATILYDQLKDLQMYEAILDTIAQGFHVWADIIKMARIPAGSNPSVYMKNLQMLELIEAREPMFAPPTGRKTRYYIRDPFLRFYYRFILWQREAIQREDQKMALTPIINELRSFIGANVWEELCREWVYAEAELGKLGFTPEQIGSFWVQSRGTEVQLDVVAISKREKQLLIGEAKWTKGKVDRSVLTDLVKRSERMPYVAEKGWKVRYVLFAREGFTEATAQAAKEIGARLVDLAQLEARLIEYAARPQMALPNDLEF